MTDIYFVRHAESFGNLTRRAYGWYDGILTQKGYRQVECLEKRFGDIPIDAVYSSDLSRARQTAKAIYKPKGLELICDPDLREIGLGAWEDRPWGEFPGLYAKEYNAWVNNPLEFETAGSENYYTVYARIKRAFDRIVAENDGKSIAVVSHGAALRMLMHGIVNNDDISEIAGSEWGDNTSVSLFRKDGDEIKPIFLNSNEHLKDMPDYELNMNWVREGEGRNLSFECADYLRDKEKIFAYYLAAWRDVFGDEDISRRAVNSKARRVLRQSRENIVFAYSTTKEVGTVVLDYDISLVPKAGHVSLVYLKPEFRRMRFGIQLIGHAMSIYRGLGMEKISIRVAEKNTPAIAFYKKYGFSEAFREIDDGVNQIVMTLDII